MAGIGSLSDTDARAVANYLYTNNDIYDALDGLYADARRTTCRIVN